MSDKVRWAGSRAGCIPRPALIDRYVLAKVEVNGSTHIGLMVEGVCFQVCNYAQNPILLPVADGEVECLQCKHIMRRKNIAVNMKVGFTEFE